MSRHEVVTADMARRMPDGFGLIIRGSCAPVIAKLQRAWKDRIYRKARRRGYAVAPVAAARPASLARPVTIADMSAVPPAQQLAEKQANQPAKQPAPVGGQRPDGHKTGSNGHGPVSDHPWGRP